MLSGETTRELDMYLPQSQSSDESAVWLRRLADHLKEDRFGSCAPDPLSHARRFLDYLRRLNLTVHTVQPSDIAIYLNTLRYQRKANRKTRLSNRARIHYRS